MERRLNSYKLITLDFNTEVKQDISNKIMEKRRYYTHGCV